VQPISAPSPSDGADAAAGRAWPFGRAYAWFVVAILALAYAISLIDRNFMGLVIEQIKRDLALTDPKIGLLLGPAFGMLYVVLGVPFGWLADRGNRQRIMASGMILWCLATAACGLAPNFPLLMASRLGVGIGEASLSPCALSLIADYVPPRSRARAMSLYVLGANLGGSMAYLLGAQVMAFLGAHPLPDLIRLGPEKPWQAAFIVLGVPGLLIAFLMLAIREPRAGSARAGMVAKPPSPFAALRLMGARWRAYATVFGAMSAMFVIGYMGLWTAAVFQRSWGWSLERIGLVNGGIILASSPPGAAFAGWLGDRLTKRGREDGAFIALIVGSVIILPSYALYPLSPNGSLAAVLLFTGLVGQHIISAAGPVAVFQVAPRQIRGQAISWYYLILSVSGLLLGPPAIGFLTAALGGPSMLRYSIAIVGFVFGVISVAILAVGWRSYRIAARERAQEDARASPA
jgi:MFS family permease